MFHKHNNSRTNDTSNNQGTDQYNGNIKALRWNTRETNLMAPQNKHHAQLFTYNDRNWLQEADYGYAFNNANNNEITLQSAYKVFGLDYDKNGNLLHLNRNRDGENNEMDRLNYYYNDGTNRLNHVEDTAVNTDPELKDIKSQSPENYIYNEIGQLVTDFSDGVTYRYNASGLVTEIYTMSNDSGDARFQDIMNYDYNQSLPAGTDLGFSVSGGTAEQYSFCQARTRETTQDYCQNLCSSNRQAVMISGDGDTAMDKQFAVIAGITNRFSFDAILYQLPHDILSDDVQDHIELDISLIDSNGNTLWQDNLSGDNTCGYYRKQNFNYEFVPTENYVTLHIEATNTNAMLTNTQYMVDNITLEVPVEPALKLYYDDKGKRIRKESITYMDNGDHIRNITWYVRDAAGNPMAIYTGSDQGGSASATATLVEQPVYGASRIGVYYPQTDRYIYQFTDHLGNVRALMSKDDSGHLVLVGATDYYPFGMPMPNRQITDPTGYRYAYQGQEKDPETGKEAFELRLWDSRIGRWLTTDPMRQFFSSYLGMGNNPIRNIDPKGGMCYYNGEPVPCPDEYSEFSGPTAENIELNDMAELRTGVIQNLEEVCIGCEEVEEVCGEGDLSIHLKLMDVIRSSTAIKNNIDNTPTAEHLENLQQLGERIFDPIYENFDGNIKISSGYRSKALNEAVGGSKTSQHSLGQALDIKAIPPVTNSDIFYFVQENLNYHQLIWEYGDSINPRWVHVGYRPSGNNRQQTFSIPKRLKTF